MRSTREKYKPWIIVGSGFLTLLLMNLFPVDGGGVSLIFVLSVPILIGLSIILALIYRWQAKKIEIRWKRNVIFSSSVLIIVLLTFLLFPCSNSDSPCPCKIIYKSSKVIANRDNITYNDLFTKKTKANYPLIITSRKKYKNRLPEKIFYVTYDSLSSFSSLKHYAIYVINDSIKSNNENLMIEHLPDDIVRFTEVFENDTLTFIGTTKGFIELENEYNGYNDNGYGYINWYKEFSNYQVRIRKGVENDIYESYLFYKLLYWLT
ncbi:hypothetical protein [Brumimicrobium mesophilum]|uniref:hypothetical protein n=1 Tax=Brumimicrobium mesophilum TaxID=392717 RepID=UPI000D13FB88|nr:hypothetical protein [Brumimicrobium mesophilum]